MEVVTPSHPLLCFTRPSFCRRFFQPQRCSETGFPLTSCSFPPTLPPGYRHGSFLLHAPCESPINASPSPQGEVIGVSWLEALAAFPLLTPANYTMY